MDSTLRELERALRANPADERLQLRYKRELERAGKSPAQLVNPYILEAIAKAINRKIIDPACLAGIAQTVKKVLTNHHSHSTVRAYDADANINLYLEPGQAPDAQQTPFSLHSVTVFGKKRQDTKEKKAYVNLLVALPTIEPGVCCIAFEESKQLWPTYTMAHLWCDPWPDSKNRKNVLRWLASSDNVIRFSVETMKEWSDDLLTAPVSKVYVSEYNRASLFQQQLPPRPKMPGNTKHRRKERARVSRERHSIGTDPVLRRARKKHK